MSETLRMISKVLEGPENYLEAKRLGIRAGMLKDVDGMVWMIIEDYYARHDNVPPVEDITRAVTTFAVVDTGNLNISELVERTRKELVEIELRSVGFEVDQHLQTQKFQEAIGATYKRLSKATDLLTVTQDEKLSSNIDAVLTDYRKRRDGDFEYGIPWPWVPLNQGTHGIEAGTFSVFYARPKSTKTFRLLEIALAARNDGNRVLIVSCEMTEMPLFRRLAAIACKLDYTRFGAGRLYPDEEQRLIEFTQAHQSPEEGREIIITTLSKESNNKSISALRAKVDEHEPDLILIDSMYKMYDEQSKHRDASPTTLRNVCYDVQQLAQTTKIPIIGTTQANRSGDKAKMGDTTDVAFSEAMLMDADLMIRLFNDKELGRTIFSVNAARETTMEGFSTGNKCCDGLGPIIFQGKEDWEVPMKYRPGGEEAPPQHAGGGAPRFTS